MTDQNLTDLECNIVDRTKRNLYVTDKPKKYWICNELQK